MTSRQSLNGWEASLSVNANRWLAGEGDFSGYYKTYHVDLSALGLPTLNVGVHDYGFLFGPRVNFRPVFAHALLGVDHLTGSALGFSASQDSFSGAFGGGLQQKVASHFAVRAGADYVFTRHNIFGGSRVTQNNVRASVGVVYMFGSTGEAIQKSKSSAKATGARPAMSIPALGVMVAPREGGGAEIVEVKPGSVAELAMLHVGDVINTVDGKSTNTPMELAAELQNRAPGSQVRLGYMFRSSALGYFSKETVVILEAQK